MPKRACAAPGNCGPNGRNWSTRPLVAAAGRLGVMAEPQGTMKPASSFLLHDSCNDVPDPGRGGGIGSCGRRLRRFFLVIGVRGAASALGSREPGAAVAPGTARHRHPACLAEESADSRACQARPLAVLRPPALG